MLNFIAVDMHLYKIFKITQVSFLARIVLDFSQVVKLLDFVREVAWRVGTCPTSVYN